MKTKETFSIFTKTVSQETVFREFRNVLGPIILHKDIIGQGENGIILLDPKNFHHVVKIKKRGEHTDDLKQEVIHHIQFTEALRVAKNRYKGLIDETIKVPQIYSGVQEKVPYIKMQRVYGQSLKTLFYRELYVYELTQLGYTKDELDSFSDHIFNLLLRFYGLYTAPQRLFFSEDFEAREIISKLTDYFNRHIYGTSLGNVLDYLEWRGLYHNDLHAGNIMIDRNNNTYIIDFGKANFDVDKSKQACETEKIIGHS